mmetsp:Transcript_35048/g.88544  ORF Transcript_35048/g.88544 Transcript_35048/m.88544 type:complete len:171 (-) Transcript_35048:209-721(-)
MRAKSSLPSTVDQKNSATMLETSGSSTVAEFPDIPECGPDGRLPPGVTIRLGGCPGSKECDMAHIHEYFDGKFAIGENRGAMEGCSVVVGMHPDEATEDLVDEALKMQKPFAVVPCCVFYKTHPGREVDGQQVRSWEQFCDYLQRKDPRIQRAALPFSGRNVVLYLNPKP